MILLQFKLNLGNNQRIINAIENKKIENLKYWIIKYWIKNIGYKMKEENKNKRNN